MNFPVFYRAYISSCGLWSLILTELRCGTIKRNESDACTSIAMLSARERHTGLKQAQHTRGRSWYAFRVKPRIKERYHFLGAEIYNSSNLRD